MMLKWEKWYVLILTSVIKNCLTFGDLQKRNAPHTVFQNGAQYTFCQKIQDCQVSTIYQISQHKYSYVLVS